MGNGYNMEFFKMMMPSIKNRSLKEKPEEGTFNFRLKMAEYQSQLPTKDKKTITKYVNEFLVGLGMEEVKKPEHTPKDTVKRRINYCEINPGSKEDIVWIKFNIGGHISVIGTGCDISFSDYAKKNTPAGIINEALNFEWDEKEVLIFPLKNMPAGLNRSDIESGIGNYLISKGVPILDYYSHNY